MRKYYETILGLETEVVAISADSPEHAMQVVDSLGLEYPVLFDTEATVIKQYGVYDLHGDGLAAPSFFIVDKSGSIRWQFISRTIKDWPDVKDVISQLEKIQEG